MMMETLVAVYVSSDDYLILSSARYLSESVHKSDDLLKNIYDINENDFVLFLKTK